MLSPRKQVPLASGSPTDRPRTRSFASAEVSQPTKRAFFCSVVFELAQRGRALPQDVQDIISSLGTQLSSDGKAVDSNDAFGNAASSSTEAYVQNGHEVGSSRPQSLADVIHELVKTERTYVQKLKALKHSYADPLRSFARNKDTAIIPAYQANTLFGNIDSLIPANEAFLADLERMIAPGSHRSAGGIGDVTRKHFKKLKTFDCYRQYYSKREEAQSIFQREVQKKSNNGFAGFIDRIQYSTSDGAGGVGLRELLMEPVQRIPRYTLMFKAMLKYMDPSDLQRAKLIEADDAASKIAQAETDDQTRRAAVMIGLERSVEDFPPALISNSRRFIDCVDVEDTMTDPSTSSSAGPPVPCTLFLFDDRLMVAKRNTASVPGRVLAGLDDMERLAKGGILSSASIRKTMCCKGVVEITDVVAADPGGSDLHLYLEREPSDQSDRWSNRPFRSLTVVHPPANAHQAPMQVAEDKKRFLENLWLAQALYRAKAGRSIPFVSDELDVGSSRKTTIARTYFNVYQRTAYLSEPNKGKIVLHIDPSGAADPIPFGVDTGPYIVVRVRPMRDGLSLYSISSCDASDEGEEDIIHTSTVASRIVTTIHQCSLFKFRTGNNSRPTTPTASTRGRAAKFNLDSISRNLFGSSRSNTVSSRGISGADYFGSDGNGSGSRKRSRSNSRASTLVTHSTGTTTTGTSDSMRFFSQRSMSTAPTSVMDGDSLGQKSRQSPRKLFSRGKSPEQTSPSKGSPSKSLDSSLEFAAMSYDALSRSASVMQGNSDDRHPRSMVTDDSELDLSLRLELARHNSLTQQNTGPSQQRRIQHSVEDTILEGLHNSSPRRRSPNRSATDSEDSSTIRHAPSVSDRPVSPAPSNHLTRPQSPDVPTRPSSAMSTRRPMGPRDLARASSIKVSDIESALERTLSQMSKNERLRTPSPPPPRPESPRKRAPLEVDNIMVNSSPAAPLTPEPPQSSAARPIVEPLSIKKKSSVPPSGPESSRNVDRELTRTPSLATQEDEDVHVVSKPTASRTALGKQPATRATSLADEMWESIERSQRSIKRIRLEIDDLSTGERGTPRSPSPTKRAHSRHTGSALEARMEEMRQAIERGRGIVPRSASPAFFNSTLDMDHLRNLVADTECDIKGVRQNHQALQAELKLIAADALDKESELIRTTNELHHTKRQCDLVKKLLSDATAENEIMYDAFNEELDGMFRDANLPETEAWTVMVADLRKTKDNRNTLTKENKSLKRSLELAQLQNEEWGALLRSHGLIP